MIVSFTPSFLRMLKHLPKELQVEALEKIESFKDEKKHKSLKVHKLSGLLKGRYSFSVNYKTRIVFTFITKNPKEALLLAVGEHDVYKT